MLMCMRKVPGRLADRWDCHSGAREELIPTALTLVISEGDTGEQKQGTLDLFVCEHVDVSWSFCAFRTCRKLFYLLVQIQAAFKNLSCCFFVFCPLSLCPKMLERSDGVELFPGNLAYSSL